MKLHNFDFSRKIFFHPDNIARYARGERPFPITVEIDLTNKCNHKCAFCFYSEHLSTSRATLDTALVLQRLEEMRGLGTKGISFTGGGEPTLHKDFPLILRGAKRLGFDLGCITNGSNVTEKNHDAYFESLQWIRFSMGGGDPESYRTVQGVDHFDRVLANLLSLCRAKRERGAGLNIGARVLVSTANLASLPGFAELLLEAEGLNYLQLAQDQFTKPGDTFWDDPATQAVFARVEKTLNRAGVRLLASGYVPLQSGLDIPRTCYAHFFQVAITAEGDVVFCKNGRGQEHAYIGNINANTLAEIWAGEKTRELEAKYKPTTCGLYCKNIALNLALEQSLHPAPDMSPNFIS